MSIDELGKNVLLLFSGTVVILVTLFFMTLSVINNLENKIDKLLKEKDDKG